MKGLTKDGTSLEVKAHNKKVMLQLQNAGLLDLGRMRKGPRQLPEALKSLQTKHTEESSHADFDAEQSKATPRLGLNKNNLSFKNLESLTEHNNLVPTAQTVASMSPLNSKPLRVARGETFEMAVGSAFRPEGSDRTEHKHTKDERGSAVRGGQSLQTKNPLDKQEHNVTMMVSQLWDNQFRNRVMGGMLDQSRRMQQSHPFRGDSVIETHPQQVILV